MKTLLAIVIALTPFRAYALTESEYMAGVLLSAQVICDNTTYEEFVKSPSGAVKKINSETLSYVQFFVDETIKKAPVEKDFIYRDIYVATHSCLFERSLREHRPNK